MSAKRIKAVVQFTAEMDDDDIRADTQVDNISDAIADAVNGLGFGVFGGSASVTDWTEENG